MRDKPDHCTCKTADTCNPCYRVMINASHVTSPTMTVDRLSMQLKESNENWRSTNIDETALVISRKKHNC